VYYKKGGIEWGSPLTITGINEIKKPVIPVVYDAGNEALQIDTETFHQPCLFELTDLSGRVLIQNQLTSGLHSIPVGFIHNGLYIYRLTANGKIIHNGKIIK
jgi:hypothetical protein